MEEAINFMLVRVVTRIFESNKQGFVSWFLHTFQRVSTYQYETDAKKAVIKILGEMGMSLERLKSPQTIIGAVEELYDIFYLLPEIFKTVIKEKQYVEAGIPFELFMKIVLRQNAKGIEKYGMTIDECPNEKYNWSEMATEEYVDYLIYLEKAKRATQYLNYKRTQKRWSS